MERTTDFITREYTPEDIPGMSALWASVFGDPGDLISGFYSMLPALGTAFVAEAHGRIAAAAHLLECMSLSLPAPQGAPELLPCGYLYAVATAPEFRSRGLGARLSAMAETRSAEHGNRIFCTAPAEPSLFSWYERTLGLKPALYRTVTEHSTGAGSLPLSPLTPEQYNAAREAALSGSAHMRLNDAGARFLSLLCSICGGGLAASSGIVLAYAADGACAELYETLPDGSDRERVAVPGFETQRLRRACAAEAPDALPYLAAKGCGIPEETVWNIIFE